MNVEPEDEYINLSIHECISRLSPKSADKLAVQEMKNKNVEEFLKAQMVHRFNQLNSGVENYILDTLDKFNYFVDD